MGMTTNELIKQLEYFNKDEYIYFDFGATFDYIWSWRGSYEQPALYWTTGHTLHDQKISALLGILIKVDGMEVEGYKGGDFTLNSSDILRLTHDESISGHLTISRISKEENVVIMHTQYEEY